MAAVQTALRGLSANDLEHIRDALAAGRRPKVVFTATAGQMAGQVGQVVRLTDPALSDDCVVVRFGKDELPFAPGDLTVAARSSSRRPAAAGVPVPRDERPVRRSPAPAVPSVSTVDAPPAADPPPAAPPAERRPAARRATRPKSPPTLTVTVSYAGGEWTVGANQGTKALVKPQVIRPADALRMVGMLDVPGVRDAVADIAAAARAEAERQAQRLRAELAAVESRLAELRETG